MMVLQINDSCYLNTAFSIKHSLLDKNYYVSILNDETKLLISKDIYDKVFEELQKHPDKISRIAFVNNTVEINYKYD